MTVWFHLDIFTVIVKYFTCTNRST